MSAWPINKASKLEVQRSKSIIKQINDDKEYK